MGADAALAAPRAATSVFAALAHCPPTPAVAAKIQNDLRILTERLARINDNLARKISSRNEYDKTIQETEAAYAKVPPHTLPPHTLPPHTLPPHTLPPHRLSGTATRLASHATEPVLSLLLRPPLRGLRASGCACARARKSCRAILTILYLLWQIMESSQTLLHVLKRESVNLTKKKQASS